MKRFELQRWAAATFLLASLLATLSEKCASQDLSSEPARSIATLAAPYKSVIYSNPAPLGVIKPLFSHGCLIQFKYQTDIQVSPTPLSEFAQNG